MNIAVCIEYLLLIEIDVLRPSTMNFPVFCERLLRGERFRKSHGLSSASFLWSQMLFQIL